MEFTHITQSQRVVLAAGKAAEHLTNEVERLGSQNPMVIASPERREVAKQVAISIDVAAWHCEVAMHVPVAVARRARNVAIGQNIDVLIPIGGGSTIGVAKAVALTTGIPIVAVPTTFSGSEGTNLWGITEGRQKTTGSEDCVLPVSVIYDPMLTLSLPIGIAVASGLNALAHCVDSMWAPRADPINHNAG
jgi:maleylacetate reductase